MVTERGHRALSLSAVAERGHWTDSLGMESPRLSSISPIGRGISVTGPDSCRTGIGQTSDIRQCGNLPTGKFTTVSADSTHRHTYLQPKLYKPTAKTSTAAAATADGDDLGMDIEQALKYTGSFVYFLVFI